MIFFARIFAVRVRGAVGRFADSAMGVDFWRRACSVWVSVVMVLTSLPLSVLVPSGVAYAAAADAVLTGVPTGSSNVTSISVTVGSDNSVTHYKYTLREADSCTGAVFTGAGVPIATAISADIVALPDGPFTLCVAGSTDNSTFDTASPTAATWTKDTAVPTISAATYHSSAITVTMSENVAVSGTKTGTDFTITGGGAPTVSSYAISNSTVTLTLDAAIADGSTVTLAYAKNSTAANRITDTAGNELAAVSSQSVTGKSVSISAVSTDDYINDAEDENSVAISGSSINVGSGVTITVAVDGSGTDVNKTGTTDSDGDWSVTLTSDEVKALDTATPPADGDVITITASAAGGGSNGTRTVIYDTTTPSGRLSPVSDGYVNAAEDDSSVQVFFRPDRDTASMTTTTISDGTDSLTAKTLTAGYRATDKISDTMRTLALDDQDEFGAGIDISGNILAIGAPNDDTGGQNRGAVYLIKDSDNDGDFSDAAAADITIISNSTNGISLGNLSYFGESVAFNDDRSVLAVGATNASGGGAVFLIASGGDNWASIQSADVTKLDNATGGLSIADTYQFGSDVAFADNGYLIVGAPNPTSADGLGYLLGKVFILKDKNSDGDYADTGERVILTNTTPGLSFIGVGEKFGYSVDAESGVLAVGAPLEGTGGDDEGMVVLIDDGGDNWASVQATDVKKLYGGVHGVPDIGNIILYNQFGSGVALEQQHDGLLLVAGSQRYIYGNYRGAIHTIKDINGDGDYGDTGEFATLKNGTHNLSIDTDDYFGASVAIERRHHRRRC